MLALDPPPSRLSAAARELVHRYVDGLRLAWPAALFAVLAAIALVVLCRRASPRFGRPAVRWALVAAAAAWAIHSSWRVKWTADDAFISFRYADNWVRGLGLVWNPGERVEGYTNFLWTALVAAAIRLGFDPVQAATVMSLACYAGLLAVVTRLAVRALPPELRALALLPLVLTAGNAYLVSFGTSGLETMFVALAMTVALERADARRPFEAGVAGAAAMMAHPDQAILVAALALAMFIERSRRRDALLFAVTVVAIFTPYYLARWSYYGEFWTNTYYTKSASRTYFSQGGAYLVIALVSGGLWGVVPGALLGLFTTRGLLGRFGWLGIPAFLVYVAKIGGDFMDGRLLTSVLPITFVLATSGVAAAWRWADSATAPLWRRVPLGGLALALAALASSAGLRVAVLLPKETVLGVADESSFYRLTRFSPPTIDSFYDRQAMALRDAFPKGDARLAAGCVGMVGYYSRLPIVDVLGLNDKVTARMPIASRGRPGHEKHARLPRVLEWGADLSVDPSYPAPYTDLGRAEIGGIPFFLIRYRPAVVGRLAAVGHFSPRDFVATLSALVDPAEASASTPAKADCDAWYVDTVYLSRVGDPALHARTVQYLHAADAGVGARADLAFTESDPERLGYRVTRRWPAEAFASDDGRAYVRAPGTMVPDQGEVFGAAGPYVDTFDDPSGDHAMVTLKSPSFPIEGDAITLSVGGGAVPESTFVGLRVDGRWVRRSAGCNAEILGRRVWDVSELRGRDAEIVVVDGSTIGWGHILVGDVVEWTQAEGHRGAAR